MNYHHQKNSYSLHLIITLLILFLNVMQSPFLHAQTISLEKDLLNDYLRNQQLADSAAPSQSFCIKPLYMQNKIAPILLTKKTKHFFSFLPLTVISEINSHHPFGITDGAMIPAKGLQLYLNGGIYAAFGKFTLQLQPEILYAQNLSFSTFPTEYPNVIWNAYYQWLNTIDNPEKYGTKAYKKILPGQSSFYFHPKNLAIGISTENVWWGPGIQNSLIMSNNAGGFLHADIHTTQPLTTPIGSFEFQVMSGMLNSSNIPPLDTNRTYNGRFLYIPKINQWRYFTGMVVSWQPKWIKGLFLGFSKASYLYHQNVGLADILPVDGWVNSAAAKNNQKAALGSVFIRYVMPEENTELYAEYGRNDKPANIINLITDQNYPRGYIVGLRKLSNLTAKKSRFAFTAEIAQLELPSADLIKSARSWYTNSYVRQGYTNDGQIIGAGIGPGGSSQTIDISWIQGFKKIGLRFERIVHNNDFYYNYFSQTGEFQRQWVDMNTTAHIGWQFKSFYINAEGSISRSLNYEWYVIEGSSFFQYGYDFLNFHGNIAIIYRF